MCVRLDPLRSVTIRHNDKFNLKKYTRDVVLIIFLLYVLMTLWEVDWELYLIAKQRYQRKFTGIEEQLYEIVRGKKISLNCLSWNFADTMKIANKVITENLVVDRQLWEIHPNKPKI